MPRGSRSVASRPARPRSAPPRSPCRWGPVPMRSGSSWTAPPPRATPCVRASARP
uniref:Coiled-coil-helix-coiled-coil-helix domain containing 10 n=1 Tax=Bos taurus TaxID=9913 RepID=A0AAA9TIV2_BOVIN